MAVSIWCCVCTWGENLGGVTVLMATNANQTPAGKESSESGQVSYNEKQFYLPCATIVFAVLGGPGAGVGPFINANYLT